MKNLFEAARVQEVLERIRNLQPDNRPLWGRMTPAQALAHCSGSMQWAVGDTIPPRGMALGRVVGFLIKPLVLGNDKPLRRNSPTAPELVVRDERDFGMEQKRLCELISRFATIGRTGCSPHPHSFFGKLTAGEWATLMYKHLDHHLRQFGV